MMDLLKLGCLWVWEGVCCIGSLSLGNMDLLGVKLFWSVGSPDLYQAQLWTEGRYVSVRADKSFVCWDRLGFPLGQVLGRKYFTSESVSQTIFGCRKGLDCQNDPGRVGEPSAEIFLLC